MCVCVCVIVWVGVGVIAWMKKGVCGWDTLDCCHKVCGEGGCEGRGGEGCVCVTALIAAVKYMDEEGERERGSVCVGVIVWVGMGVIAWVWKGVCGRDSLDCCLKVCACMCVFGEGGEGGEGGGVCVCVCVDEGVTGWVGV